jgi:hypothetical protein
VEQESQQMTRKEAYEFLLDHCKFQVKVSSFSHTHHNKDKWEACVELMQAEETFHMNLFGKTADKVKDLPDSESTTDNTRTNTEE